MKTKIEKRSETLENTYQSVAMALNNYYYRVVDAEYPKLIVVDSYTRKKYEIIIKELH